MLCEKNGKQDSATERRIHNSGDVLPSLHHYDALPYPVILSGGKNALWEKQGDGYVIRSEESIILMTPYRFPHYDVLPSAVILTNILYIKLFFYNISRS